MVWILHKIRLAIAKPNLRTNVKMVVTVQDGGKTGAKAGVRLAYKHDFAPVFTSEVPPILLE